MINQVTRRDFLKLAGLLPISIAAPRFMSSLENLGNAQNNPQNVLVIVFDAWSAYHVSLYGYHRDTMPNLARLADRAVVYHNHYAGGNYTTPGTASLLTGTHPWTHRAFQPGGRVPEALVPDNIFSAFENYYRITYSHNLWANLLLRQFKSDLDQYISKKKYFLTGDGSNANQGFFLDSNAFIPALFENDEDIALVSWIRAMEKKRQGTRTHSFCPRFTNSIETIIKESNLRKLKPFSRAVFQEMITTNSCLNMPLTRLADYSLLRRNPLWDIFTFGRLMRLTIRIKILRALF